MFVFSISTSHRHRRPQSPFRTPTPTCQTNLRVYSSPCRAPFPVLCAPPLRTKAIALAMGLGDLASTQTLSRPFVSSTLGPELAVFDEPQPGCLLQRQSAEAREPIRRVRG